MGNIAHHPSTFAPAPAVMSILNRFNREELGHTIEVLIALLDLTDGDADAESGTDLEDDFVLSEQALCFALSAPDADPIDQDAGAWMEWDTLRASLKRGPNLMAGHEDDEEDDDAGQSTEDEVSYGDPGFGNRGPGCPISDPDKAIDDDACDESEQEREREQMVDDVPMLPVYSLDHNIFNDQRVKLGYSNLMTSFISCGGEVRSAETGGVLVTQFDADQPGVPV